MNIEDYHELFTQSSALKVAVDTDFNVLNVSDGFLHITQNERDNIVGKYIFDVFPEISNDIDENLVNTMRDSFNKVLSEKATYTSPVVRYQIPSHTTENGKEVRYWKVINTPFLDDDENVKFISQRFVDVTDNRKLSEQLEVEKNNLDEYKTAAEYIENALKQAPAPICILRGPEHIFEMANKEFLHIVPDKDIIGKPAREVMPELEGQGFLDILDEVYSTGKSYVGSEMPATFNVGRDKEVDAYVDFIYKVLYDTDGEKSGIFVLAIDVTDQVLARKKAEESEYRYRALIENSPVATAIFKGPDIIIEYANDKMLDYWNRDKSVFGKSIRETLPELETESFFDYFDNVYKTGETYTGVEEKAILEIDGEPKTFYINLTLKALRDNEGKIYGILKVAVDVTDQVLDRKKAEESEYLYRTLIEESPVATALFTGSDIVLKYANDMMLDYWNKDKSAFGKPIREFLSELNGQPFFKYIENVYKTGDTYKGEEEEALLMRDGKINTFYFNFTYKALRDSEGEIYGVHNIAIDVTEQVLAKRALEKNRETLNQLLNSMPQKISHTDAEGNIIFFNQQWVKETGLTRDELRKNGWKKALHPDDIMAVKENWIQSVKTGSDFEVECRIYHKDLGYRWHLNRAVPVTNDEGDILMWVGSNTDIHEQKKHEETLEKAVRERTKELEQAYKDLLVRNEEKEKQKKELEIANKELESFAYISSHDLQEPLRKIQIFIGRIIEKESLSKRGEYYFDRIQDGAYRMRVLIDDLLYFSRVNNTEKIFQKIDLNIIIEDVKKDMKEEIKEINATVEIGKICEVNVITFQFRQLMKNLFSNALKFSKPDESPYIYINGVIKQGSDLDAEILDPEKTYCHIIFKDNGIGFEAEYSERIFEVFQRLHSKDEFSGTGIGLAIVKKIVDNHNGFIFASGKPNEFARFDIYLPVEHPESS